MGCDLCGSNSEMFSALIENSLMNVCKKCLSFGKPVERNKDFNVNEIAKKKVKNEKISLLKENYNSIIKESREKLKLSPEDFAKKLNEKVSLIHKVENKEIIPSDAFVKKIENFFHIKLFDEYQDSEINLNIHSAALTIGDLIKIKKRK